MSWKFGLTVCKFICVHMEHPEGRTWLEPTRVSSGLRVVILRLFFGKAAGSSRDGAGTLLLQVRHFHSSASQVYE